MEKEYQDGPPLNRAVHASRESVRTPAPTIRQKLGTSAKVAMRNSAVKRILRATDLAVPNFVGGRH